MVGCAGAKALISASHHVFAGRNRRVAFSLRVVTLLTRTRFNWIRRKRVKIVPPKEGRSLYEGSERVGQHGCGYVGRWIDRMGGPGVGAGSPAARSGYYASYGGRGSGKAAPAG